MNEQWEYITIGRERHRYKANGNELVIETYEAFPHQPKGWYPDYWPTTRNVVQVVYRDRALLSRMAEALRDVAGSDHAADCGTLKPVAAIRGLTCDCGHDDAVRLVAEYDARKDAAEAGAQS